jgi:hypothetical protein
MTDERTRAMQIARSLAHIDARNALADAVEEITRLGGFAPRQKSAPILAFEAFDAVQRDMLRLIAAKPVGHNQAISGWTGAGVPKDTPSRRRWSGFEPPGVLEHVVNHEGRPVARWLVMQQLLEVGVDASTIESRLASTMSRAQWCELLFVVFTNAYGLHGRFGAALPLNLLEHAIADASDDVVRWVREKLEFLEAHDVDPVVCGVVTPKMFGPLLRAAVARGLPIAACFDPLVEWTTENRPVLAAIPETRRHQTAARIVSAWGAGVLGQRLESLEALADLLVCTEVVLHLETTARQWPALKPLLPRVRALKTIHGRAFPER